MAKKKRIVVIGPRTRDNFLFLYKLLETKSAKQRYNIIQNCSREELLALLDICSNVMRSGFKLKAQDRRKIAKHKEVLDRLVKTRSEKSARKWIQTGEGVVLNPNAKRTRDRLKVVQRGGLIPAVLAPILIELAAEGAEHLIPDPPKDYLV